MGISWEIHQTHTVELIPSCPQPEHGVGDIPSLDTVTPGGSITLVYKGDFKEKGRRKGSQMWTGLADSASVADSLV